ncbi:MAG: rod shape-determining protein RodA [Raoultibacter sp.]
MAEQRMQQIASVKAVDKQVANATRPRRFKALNIPLLIVIVLLVGYGLLVVYSATATNPDYQFSRQLSTVAVGTVIMLLLWRFDYHQLSDFTLLFLIVTVVLILLPHLPVIGVNNKGATSWISLLGIQVQPGEFAKVTVVLLAASVVSRYGGKLDDPREYLKALGILAVPFLCIMTQPDLGTGLVYCAIAAVALIAGGARVKYLLITLVALVFAVVAVFAIDEFIKGATGEYKLLKQYQRARLLVFIDPSYSASDEGYNLKQATVAIGSGGMFGKGFMQATQSTLGFLPEAPTDFIFCVLAEELGFFGVLVLIVLYLALLLISFQIARCSNDLFGALVVMCIVGMWLFQILENIGMTCGLMPITGIPLPFVSYGSSFMVVNFIMLGLIGSIWAHNSR